MPDSYDLVIIGSGIAGLSAGIYAARGKLKTLILEEAFPGGQAFSIHRIENYPGFPQGIAGFELTDLCLKQAKNFGLEIKEQAASAVLKTTQGFTIKTVKAEYQARTVIMATGARPRKLEVPGEEEFYLKGVSYCATCDGPLYRGKPVLVVGGGNSAVQEALFLSTLASQVYLLHRRDTLRAFPLLVERAGQKTNLKLILSSVLKAILGKARVEKAVIKSVIDEKESELLVDGIFIYAGNLPSSQLVKELVECDESGFIVTDEQMRTRQPGLFAAGDVRKTSLRQIVTAAADGARAAVSAIDYLLTA